MLAFAIRDLREHTGELVKNAENLQCSIVSKHGKPLFIALPFDDALLASGAAISLADKLLKSGELSIAAAAKLSGMSYLSYLKHLGNTGYSLIDDTNYDEALTSELAHLQKIL